MLSRTRFADSYDHSSNNSRDSPTQRAREPASESPRSDEKVSASSGRNARAGCTSFRTLSLATIPIARPSRSTGFSWNSSARLSRQVHCSLVGAASVDGFRTLPQGVDDIRDATRPFRNVLRSFLEAIHLPPPTAVVSNLQDGDPFDFTESDEGVRLSDQSSPAQRIRAYKLNISKRFEAVDAAYQRLLSQQLEVPEFMEGLRQSVPSFSDLEWFMERAKSMTPGQVVAVKDRAEVASGSSRQSVEKTLRDKGIDPEDCVIGEIERDSSASGTAVFHRP